MNQGPKSALKNSDHSSPLIKVGIVDDHMSANTSYAFYLNQMPGIRSVLQAHSGGQLLELLKAGSELPDILLMDVEMKPMNGIETTRVVTAHYPTIKIIAFTAKEDNWNIVHMIRAGAWAYLSKKISVEEMEKAIREVHQKGKYLADLYYTQLAHLRQYSKTIENLSFSEHEMLFLQLLGKGYDYGQIAEAMGVTTDTVKYYKGCISRKLGIKTKEMILLEALRMGIITLHEDKKR